MDKKVFGQRLRHLRKSRTKYNVKEFGALFNLAESTISGYENGARMPDTGILHKFADYFDVTLDYLTGRTDNPNSDAGDNREKDVESIKEKIATEFPDVDLMFQDLESLTADDLKEVYEYIKFKKSQKGD